ncbi:MAG: hypothetical protein HKN55_03465 [Woeseiaceae bacterium]|nr:hypothetical protein [Gammaproteobacteria bacterium]NND46699.1 hypothetical protein [Woeseiaceae bacterium]
MMKWKAVTTFGLVCSLVLATSVRAQQNAVSVDGCAELARAVYEEVSSAAINGTHRGGPWVISPRHEHVSVCETTTRTVSRAFTHAMASAGIDVQWGIPGSIPHPGDYCLSAFLSQCYPDRYPLGQTDDMFVQSSWAVVSHSVMRAMANPFGSDEVRFRPNELKLHVGLALRSVKQTH